MTLRGPAKERDGGLGAASSAGGVPSGGQRYCRLSAPRPCLEDISPDAATANPERKRSLRFIPWLLEIFLIGRRPRALLRAHDPLGLVDRQELISRDVGHPLSAAARPVD